MGCTVGLMEWDALLACWMVEMGSSAGLLEGGMGSSLLACWVVEMGYTAGLLDDGNGLHR